MKFKKGDRVKLKDYSKFSDHRKHKGQTGTVHDVSSGYGMGIRWSDGTTSRVWFSDQKPYKVGGRSKKECDIKFEEVM